MADRKNEPHFDPLDWEDEDFQPIDVSEPLETKYEPDDPEHEEFEAPDVSEPRPPRKEIEIIEEALAIRRRDWIKAHMSYIYAAVGVVLVGLIAFGIFTYYKSTNPLSRFVSSVSKDFGSSFDFDVKMTEDGEAVMSYQGSIEPDRGKHTVKAYYEADYNRYSFTGAVYADADIAANGSYYDQKWTVHDCTDQVTDFFEFDRKFRSGGFDGGAFLRFTGIISDFSTREVESMAGILRDRFSTNSPLATITSSQIEEGTLYEYDVDLYELFSMVQKNGASLFYRATDYDRFSAIFDQNKGVVEEADCAIRFVVDPSGYMTSFEITVTAQDVEYGLSCTMSDFGAAEVEIPEDFMKAAALNAAQE
ncbi:MAG: hypothetical protein IJV48_03350 [Ruminococcus sp.]|nr:hypothetical protein [Ruminococcus sp.]